jgi:hypothetical protein
MGVRRVGRSSIGIAEGGEGDTGGVIGSKELTISSGILLTAVYLVPECALELLELEILPAIGFLRGTGTAGCCGDSVFPGRGNGILLDGVEFKSVNPRLPWQEINYIQASGIFRLLAV